MRMLDTLDFLPPHPLGTRYTLLIFLRYVRPLTGDLCHKGLYDSSAGVSLALWLERGR